MKILLISEFFPTGKDLKFSGGVEARTFFVAKHLAKHHDVNVVCTLQPGSKIKETILGIKIHRVGPSLPYNAGSGKINIFKLASFMISAVKEGKKIKPDIVDGGNFVAHTIAKQISRSSKIPLVFWYPDVFIGKWIKTSGLISGLGGWLNEKLNLLRGADQFIAISQVTKDKLVNNGISQSKIKILPCAIEPTEFSRPTAKHTKFTIICVSRLVPYKRVADLIWALALLNKKGLKANLLIVGQGPQEDKLKKLIKMLNLINNVAFKSNLKRSELISAIRDSKIFCLPSETEGFGISVIEAAASGVPYVISDIPVFKEITKNGQGGLLFGVGNIKDMALKIENLLTHKILYGNKSREGRQLAKDYQWGKIAIETEKVYKKLL